MQNSNNIILVGVNIDKQDEIVKILKNVGINEVIVPSEKVLTAIS